MPGQRQVSRDQGQKSIVLISLAQLSILVQLLGCHERTAGTAAASDRRTQRPMGSHHQARFRIAEGGEWCSLPRGGLLAIYIWADARCCVKGLQRLCIAIVQQVVAHQAMRDARRYANAAYAYSLSAPSDR